MFLSVCVQLSVSVSVELSASLSAWSALGLVFVTVIMGKKTLMMRDAIRSLAESMVGNSGCSMARV